MSLRFLGASVFVALAALAPISAQEVPQVTGVVVWGKMPLPGQKVMVLVGKANAAGCPANVPDEDITVNPKNGGLRDVFVWFEPAEKGAKFAVPAAIQKPSKAAVEIDQPNCAFEPHALAMLQGQDLIVKNSSKMAHNFKWGGSPEINEGGNPLIPPGGQVVLAGIKADRIPVGGTCSVHTWMKAYVRVFEHPYFAVTDADGKFTMPAPPAGTHVLKIWHGEGWIGGAPGRFGQKTAVTGAAQDLGTFKY